MGTKTRVGPKSCKECGRPFPAEGAKKYCCPECKEKAYRRMHEAANMAYRLRHKGRRAGDPCMVCGKRASKAYGYRYCDIFCMDAHASVIGNESKPDDLIQYQCKATHSDCKFYSHDVVVGEFCNYGGVTDKARTYLENDSQVNLMGDNCPFYQPGKRKRRKQSKMIL